MKYNLNTHQFGFMKVDFYESIADPRYMFDWEEESDESGMSCDELWNKFNFDWYRAEWIPYIQSIADQVVNEMGHTGLISIKVTKVDSPAAYNFQSDWAEMEVEVSQDWREKAIDRAKLYWKDKDCMDLVESLKTRDGFWSFTPESTKEWEDAWRGRVYYADEILLGFYLSMEFLLKFGPEEANDNFEIAVDRFHGNESLFNFIEEEKK